MASQECAGKLLAGSGWDHMFSMANIPTRGVASSLLGGSHIKRTRYAYHLTLSWLHTLKIQAYNDYCKTGFEPHESFDMWGLAETASTVSYWKTVREYLLINCRFVRGLRSANWLLTLKACEDLCPWFFTFGHTNYARWMPVFLSDMARLQTTHPTIHTAFVEGQCVVQRSNKKFSMNIYSIIFFKVAWRDFTVKKKKNRWLSYQMRRYSG